MDVLRGPCATLSFIMKEISAIGRFMGLEYLRPNFTVVNKKFGIFVICIIVYFSMIINTFGNRESLDAVAVTFIIATICMSTQGIFKFYVFILQRSKLLELTGQFHKIYQRNLEHPTSMQVLDRSVKHCQIAFRAIKFLYFTAIVTLSLAPLIVGILLGERILPIGIYLPYSDPSKSPGFEISYLLSVYMIFLGLRGLTSPESYFVVHVILGIGHLNMIMQMMDELNVVVQTKTLDPSPKLEREIEARIKDIVYEHQEHLRFAKLLRNIFSSNSLVVVGTASLMIVTCLALLVQQFWLLGIVMIAMALWQILFICFLGTAFESSCEQLAIKTYSVDWYLFTPRLRKHWFLIFRMTQSPILNTIGDVWPSNLNNFIMILRAMYSILMMLLELVE